MTLRVGIAWRNARYATEYAAEHGALVALRGLCADDLAWPVQVAAVGATVSTVECVDAATGALHGGPNTRVEL